MRNSYKDGAMRPKKGSPQKETAAVRMSLTQRDTLVPQEHSQVSGPRHQDVSNRNSSALN